KTLLSGSYVLLTVSTHPPHRFWSTMTALFLVNDALHRLLGPPCPRRPSRGVDGIRMYGSHHLTKQGGERLKRNCTVKTPPTHPARADSCRRRLRTRETCRRPAQINPPSHAPGARIRASVSCGTSVLKYKPLRRMTPKLREKISSLFAVLWAYFQNYLLQARGFHASRSPYRSASFTPFLSRRRTVDIRRDFPMATRETTSQHTDARQPALPGN